MIFSYREKLYPEYIRNGNACQFITPIAQQFCKKHALGLDVGAGVWPLPGAIPFELKDGNDAMNLPDHRFEYIFSSHCLEHLANPVAALEHWKSRLVEGGVLFLYLPHPDMEYWKPENCRKHLHSWAPERMAEIVSALGFKDVIHSQRDLAWGFSVVGFNG